MPNLANAKKALRQSDKRAARNKVLIEELYSMRRRFRRTIEKGQLEEAKKMIPVFDKKLDKAVTKNVLKKNKAARMKSRLSAMLKRATEK